MAAFDDCSDHAFADARTAAAFVEHHDAVAVAGVFCNGCGIQRLQPAQIDDAGLLAGLRCDRLWRCAVRTATPLPKVTISRSVASGVIDAFGAQFKCLVGCRIRE